MATNRAPRQPHTRTAPKQHPSTITPLATAPLPPNKAPLVWGQWPAPTVRLTIRDLPGSYSFFQPFACGEWNAVQVVNWQERTNPHAARLVVGIDRISRPIEIPSKPAPKHMRVKRSA